MQDYLLWMKNKGYRDNTIQRYQQAYFNFKLWYENAANHPFNPILITGLDLNDWQQYLLTDARTKHGKPYAISTVINYIESLKTYLLYLYETGQIPTNLADNINTQKNKQIRSPKWLNRKEKSILLKFIDDPVLKEKNPWKYHRNLAIILTMLMAGLRMSEVVNLNTFDLENGYIYIRDGKGGKARMIPMNKDLLSVMQNWNRERDKKETENKEALFLSQKGGRITRSTIRELMDRIRNETSLSELTPHVLRHTFCYDLASRGVPDRQIADLAGHTDINTTRIYTTSAKEDYLNAVNLISTGKFKEE
jgi:integrase/recombinase XerD